MLRFTMKLEVGHREKATEDPMDQIEEHRDDPEPEKVSTSDSDDGVAKPFRVRGFQGGAA